MFLIAPEIQGIIFALITALLRAFGILCCVYLQTYKGASATQVLFVVEFGVFLQMALYIASNETARHHFKYLADMHHHKLILLYRSVAGGLSTLFLYISGYYLRTGDIGSLYNISIILFSFLATIYSYSNVVTLSTIMGIPIAVIGIIFICQPPFLFKGDDALSLIGVLAVCGGGALRSYCNLIVHQNTNIHWSLIVVMTSFVCSIVALIFMALEYLYNNYYLRNETFVVWATFGGSFLTNAILSSMAIRSVVLMVFITLTFQMGANYLGLEIILSTAEVLFCYLLEYLLLSVTSNKMTYFGVICIIIASIVINYQMHRTKGKMTRGGYAVGSQESSTDEADDEYPQVEIVADAQDSMVMLIVRHWMRTSGLKLDEDPFTLASMCKLVERYNDK